MKTIRFKSIPAMFRKEFNGLKCNTLRRFDEDIRFEVLNQWVNNELTELDIEIENSVTHEVFVREVTDVTKYEDYYIISWRAK